MRRRSNRSRRRENKQQKQKENEKWRKRSLIRVWGPGKACGGPGGPAPPRQKYPMHTHSRVVVE